MKFYNFNHAKQKLLSKMLHVSTKERKFKPIINIKRKVGILYWVRHAFYILSKLKQLFFNLYPKNKQVSQRYQKYIYRKLQSYYSHSYSSTCTFGQMFRNLLNQNEIIEKNFRSLNVFSYRFAFIFSLDLIFLKRYQIFVVVF